MHMKFRYYFIIFYKLYFFVCYWNKKVYTIIKMGRWKNNERDGDDEDDNGESDCACVV